MRPDQPDMNLPPGKTCADCRYFKGCRSFVGVTGTEDNCDWSPSRFIERAPPVLFSQLTSEKP